MIESRPAPASQPQPFGESSDRASQAAVFFVGGIAGVLLGFIAIATVAGRILPTIISDQPKMYWYLSRSSAIVAYSLLWISMVAGLSMTTKLAKGLTKNLTMFDIHQVTSLLALGVAWFHALILMGDRYLGISLGQIVLPFSVSGYRPIWVGLGQVGIYLMAAVSVTFWMRQWITTRGWRIIHWATFASYAIALLHGIGAGTDSGSPIIAAWYWGTGAVLLFLTVGRGITYAFARTATVQPASR